MKDSSDIARRVIVPPRVVVYQVMSGAVPKRAVPKAAMPPNSSPIRGQ